MFSLFGEFLFITLSIVLPGVRIGLQYNLDNCSLMFSKLCKTRENRVDRVRFKLFVGFYRDKILLIEFDIHTNCMSTGSKKLWLFNLFENNITINSCKLFLYKYTILLVDSDHKGNLPFARMVFKREGEGEGEEITAKELRDKITLLELFETCKKLFHETYVFSKIFSRIFALVSVAVFTSNEYSNKNKLLRIPKFQKESQ